VLASTQEEIERMSTMVNQLLTLARADAGEEQINLEPVALDALTRTVVDGMDPLAQEGGLALTFRASAPVWVEGDPGRLRQLVINLLDNAMRHTPPGGRVDITVARRGNWAILRVADTGDGISSEDLPHIFQRFYRGDRARSRVMGNSGLGLAIVKWIVEAHGGHIHVSSSPGEGSAFTVTLPATLGRLAAPPLLQARV
jgi:signal transduction histidine kinase